MLKGNWLCHPLALRLFHKEKRGRCPSLEVVQPVSERSSLHRVPIACLALGPGAIGDTDIEGLRGLLGSPQFYGGTKRKPENQFLRRNLGLSGSRGGSRLLKRQKESPGLELGHLAQFLAGCSVQ